MDCNCPAPTALTTIVAEACGVDMKQIQRMGFQRLQGASPFTAATILELATWQAFSTAEDDTKIVYTPIVRSAIIEPGDAITTGGGDNSTLNGVEEIEGVNPSNFTGMFKSISPAVEKQLKALICETGLTVYFFLSGGRIAAKKITAPAAGVKGFEIQSFFVSDRNNQGFGTKDTNNVRFSLAEGWSEDMEIYTPTFNPVTDL